MPDTDFRVDERLSSAATLPSWCYTQARALEAEQERVFARTWQLVGRENGVHHFHSLLARALRED